MKKNDVYKIDYSENGKGFDIGLPANFPLGNQEDLLKFPYIKYIPNMVVSSGLEKADICVLRFLEGSKNLQDFIIKEIKYWIASKKTPKEQRNIVSLLEQLERVFKTKKFDGDLEELLGDLGEVFFLYKLENLKVNWTNFYQKDEKTLFDSYFKMAKTFVEIKTTTTGSKNMYIDLKQLVDAKNKNSLYCSVCVEKIQNGLNIIELTNKLKLTSKVLENIKIKWQSRYSSLSNLIDSYTVSDSTQIFFVDGDLIPKIKIVHRGGFAGGKIKVLINELNKLEFEKTIKFLLK